MAPGTHSLFSRTRLAASSARSARSAEAFSRRSSAANSLASWAARFSDAGESAPVGRCDSLAVSVATSVRVMTRRLGMPRNMVRASPKVCAPTAPAVSSSSSSAHDVRDDVRESAT